MRCCRISGSSGYSAVQRGCDARADHDKGAEHGGCESEKLIAVLGVHLEILCKADATVQASWADTDVMAGAMLVPTVMKAQTIAANTEANWVRVEMVMSNLLYICIPEVSGDANEIA